MCMLRSLLFFLLIPVCAQAQPAATAVKTLVSTDTSATSICAGGNTIKAPTSCIGGVKFGTVQFPTSVAPTANGSIFRAANTGLTMTGVAGVVYDWSVYIPSAASPVIGNPTGTQAVVFPGGSVTIGTSPTVSVTTDANTSAVLVGGGTLGTGNRTGALLLAGANSSGSGAAGILNLQGKAVGANYIWADASATPGVLRISTAAPEEDGTPSDTSGTVVGSQTSTLDTKRVLGPGVSPAHALATMLRTPTFRFVYRGGSYSGTVFEGIAADLSPEFAMDPDTAHPNGRSFNPVNALGYTVQAMKALQAEIDALRADVQALRQEVH